MTPKVALAVLGTLFLFASTAQARADQLPSSGTLRVVVHDPSGAVVPGAAVQVAGTEGAATSLTRKATVSDGRGVAVAEDLPPGRYTLTVSFPGFETRTIADVRVRPGENRRDVNLAIEKVNQSV